MDTMDKKNWAIDRKRKAQGNQLKGYVLSKVPPKQLIVYLMRWFNYAGLERQTEVPAIEFRIIMEDAPGLSSQKKAAINKKLRDFSSKVYEGLLLGEKPTYLLAG